MPTWADTSGSGTQSGPGYADSSGPVIDVDTANANLLSVVQILKAESNAQIMVVSGQYSPVTCTVSLPLAQALQYVAQSAGAVVTRDANGVYTFRPASDADAAAQDASAQAPSAPVEEMHNERIALQYADPNYILNMLGVTNGYRDTDPADNPVNQTPMAHPNLAPEITSGPPAISPGFDNSGQVPASAPGNQGNYDGSITANDSVPGQGQQANQVPGFGGFNGNGGAVINPFQNGAGVAPTPGGAGAPGFGGPNAAGATLRPQGIDTIVADEQDNSLIVRGTADGIRELKQLISYLDRTPKQVQIKVQYITTTVNDADQFGISWDLIPFPNVDVNFDGGGVPSTEQPGNTVLAYAQGNLVARMQFLLSTTKGKLVNSLTISTTNNTPATANFSTVVPYQTSTTVSGGTAGATTSTSTNFISVPNTLVVTPRINGDDSVSLYITPTISTATQATPGSAPTVSTQSVSTYRTLANGETMVIGGLVLKQDSEGADKVPFLSDLPIIGPLFRTRDTSVSGSELLIFVTPEVLPPVGAYYGEVQASGVSATDDDESGAPVGSPVGVGVGVSP